MTTDPLAPLAELLADHERRLAALEAKVSADPDPDPSVLLAGPRFPRDLVGRMPNDPELYEAFGVAQTHDVVGDAGAVAVDERTLAIRHRAGQPVKDEQLSMWFDVPPAVDVDVSFTLDLIDVDGAPTDVGGQAKFGVLLEGLHSGKAWPGGGVCHPPDSLIRTVWQGPSRGGPRWALYFYLQTSPPALSGSWGGQVTGGGYRHLVPINPALSRPKPGGRHEIRWRLTGADGEQDAELTLWVGGVECWAGPLGPVAPINVAGITSRYGGPQSDAPVTSTGHQISDVLVRRLS